MSYTLQSMEGCRGKPRRHSVQMEKFGGYKTEAKARIERRERQALKNNVEEEERLEVYGRLREDILTKTYLHGPMDYAKVLKLQFRVGDLDLPERRKRCTGSWEEEDAQICPSGKSNRGWNKRCGRMRHVQGGTGCVGDEVNRRMRYGKFSILNNTRYQVARKRFLSSDIDGATTGETGRGVR